MKPLKIAYTAASKDYFSTYRDLVSASDTDFTDIAAVVLTDAETEIINIVDAIIAAIHVASC